MKMPDWTWQAIQSNIAEQKQRIAELEAENERLRQWSAAWERAACGQLERAFDAEAVLAQERRAVELLAEKCEFGSVRVDSPCEHYTSCFRCAACWAAWAREQARKEQKSIK